MAIAKLSDVRRIHAPERRITGSSDIPLSPVGEKEASSIGNRLKGKFTKVFSSPMKRALETARKIDPRAEPDHFLGPLRAGRFESQPAQQARPQMDEWFKHRPTEYPGKSPFSGKQGETPAAFKMRVKQRFKELKAMRKPGVKILAMTHGRNINEMGGGHVQTGNLLHVGEGGKLTEVSEPDKDGLYLARHAGTAWTEGGEAS